MPQTLVLRAAPPALVLAALLAVPTGAAPAGPVNASGAYTADPNDARVALSADGRWVAFDGQRSPACRGLLNTGLSAPSTAECVTQVYLYDTVRGTTELVSRAPAGTPGNGASRTPTISDDGRYVAFTSAATNLAPTPKGASLPLFVYDRVTRKVARAKVPASARTEQARIYQPHLSPDGQAILIDPTIDLANGKPMYVERGPLYALWWRTGRLVPVSVDASGRLDTNHAYDYGFSRDSRYVVYNSEHRQGAGDEDDLDDVYVRDLVARRTISATATIPDDCPPTTAATGCGTAYRMPRIDAAGRVIAFAAEEPRSDSPSSYWRLGVRDLRTGVTKMVPVSAFVTVDASVYSLPYVDNIALSGDGRHVFATTPNVIGPDGVAGALWHWDTATGTVTRVAGGMELSSNRGAKYEEPAASRDGRTVAFVTSAGLDPGDDDELEDAYVARVT